MRFSMLIAACSILCTPALADVKLPAVIGDHMVLQRETEAPVWGWAMPGEEVRVRSDWGARVDAVTSADGRWSARIATPRAGGPHSISFEAESGVARVEDVWIGEVWVCSGQSNMEWPLAQSEAGADEIAAADWPGIRVFDVQRAFSAAPLADCEGTWKVCSPETIAGFSAVGYYFGRELHTELGVPIGLIGTNWGGTLAEAWTSEATLARREDFRAALAATRMAREQPEAIEAAHADQTAEWWRMAAERDAGSGAGAWHAAELEDSDWDLMELPQPWEQAELAFDGFVWFRKSFELSHEWTTRAALLELGPIDDMDTCWLNGRRVGGLEGTGHWTTPRAYAIEPGILHAGRNVVCVRVLDTGGAGGLTGKPEQLVLRRDGDAGAVSLAGAWRYRTGAPASELPRWPSSQAFYQNSPTALFNGMLAPLIPFAIRGAIWYQGESNRERAQQYRTLFPAMIADWREHWGQGDFPFYFVQIAPFAYDGDRGEAAELREAQALASRVERTGMAVTMDVGNPADIHPRDKRTVGKRLSLWALARTYGRDDIECSGPVYRSTSVEGNTIRLSFEHVGDGLLVRNGPLKNFTIAAADRVFVEAQARIDGDSILVSSEEVAAPVAVRFAWGAADESNLFNSAGLPASSFRTDDWPGVAR